jgi:hypothetical protein
MNQDTDRLSVRLDDSEIARALRTLPQLEPSERVWQRIQARRGRRQHRWYGPALAIAATAVMAVALTLMLPAAPPDPGPDADALADLAAQSDELERLLVGLDPDARVLDMETAGTIVALEDGIAAVDGRLRRAALRPNEAELLWQQRVELMRALVGVHATNASIEF